MKHGMRLAFQVCVLVCVAGCAEKQLPIVSDPPEHTRAASEAVPWEEQYGRAMMKPGAVPDEFPDQHEHQKFNGQMADDGEQRGALGVVADVLAFPFRAVGWLFQVLF